MVGMAERLQSIEAQLKRDQGDAASGAHNSAAPARRQGRAETAAHQTPASAEGDTK